MSAEIIQRLAQAFRDNSKELYLVGGTVRDGLLGRPSHDIDCATNALPEEIKQIVAETRPLHIVPIGEKFGTIQVIYPDNVIIEITTYRGERYQPSSRKPEVRFGSSLHGDLRRRDFTINAIAKNPLTGHYVDPHLGRRDLKNGVIRAVGYAPQRFADDPLRLMRAVRFAVQLNFHIYEVTLMAMQEQSQTIQQISQERIRDEICKTLVTDHPAQGLKLLYEAGLLAYILPEVEALRGVEQPPHHKLDVYEHTLLVVQMVPVCLEVRLAALLHDIAKPATKTIDDRGNSHFYEHEDVGAEMARDILRRLRFGNETVEYVSKIIKLHMRVNGYSSKWSNGSVRRLFVDAGDVLDDLLDLAIADGASDRHERREAVEARIDELRERIAHVQALAMQQPLTPPLNGDELMALFNRPAGPWLKPLKRHLHDLVIEGALSPTDKQSAIESARTFIESL